MTCVIKDADKFHPQLFFERSVSSIKLAGRWWQVIKVDGSW